MINSEDQAFMVLAARLTDEQLERLLPKSEGEAVDLYRAMRYSVFSGGKRLRPTLFLAVLRSLGKDINDYLPFAAALEMIHTYSLIHDDLPAMDNDDFRRGRPSSHKVFGEATAILAGDALLTHAFYAMTCVWDTADSALLAQAVAYVARCAGIGGMVSGQQVDLQAQGRAADLGQLDFIYRNKTGELFAASTVSAAILGGADEGEQAALRQYAMQFGLAFQITDDLLDLHGDAAVLGKLPGSDLKNQKSTYISFLGEDGARRAVADAVAKAVAAVAFLGDKAGFFQDLALSLQKRDK